MSDDPEKAMEELVRLSEELGLYDIPAEVCTAHRRFVPCRKSGPHAYSSDPGDVEMVRRYQSELVTNR